MARRNSKKSTTANAKDDPGLPLYQCSIPSPDNTFIIRTADTNEVLTLHEGGVKLSTDSSDSISSSLRGGSIYWDCEERKGWLAFRNPTSGKYLGHNGTGELICKASGHNGWENFCPRMAPDGTGYHLLMTHWAELWKVGVTGEGMLAKVPQEGTPFVWEFVKVY